MATENVGSKNVIEEVRRAAESMGGCEPQWLIEGSAPDFTVVEGAKNGPRMLLLHGLLGALSNWDSTFPLFEKFSSPMALQLPLLTGHRSEVKIKALAAYALYFIKSRNLAPIAVCGNSLGGHVALRLYLAAPEIVDCLILTGTSGLYEHSVDTLPVRPTPTFIREHMKRVFKSRAFITDEAVEEIHQVLRDRRNVLNLIHAARSAKRDNLLQHLPNVKVPTLLLWGLDDEVTTMDVAETFNKHMPDSELITIKECGHAPMIEHPVWFAEEVQRFLKQHSKQ